MRALGITRPPAGHVLFLLALFALVLPAIRAGTSEAADALPRRPPVPARSGTLAYATFLGGVGRELDWGLAVDAAGAVYVAGWTDSADFPTTPGAYQTTFGGNDDGFVAKLSPDGTRLEWATYLGGVLWDGASAVAIDGTGNVYVVGTSNGGTSPLNGFPTTPGAFDPSYNGATDAFVAKLSPDGTRLLWSSYLGASGNENARGVAVDAVGNVYVTGFTDSPGFPTTPGAFDRTCGTNGTCNFNGFQPILDGFVAEVSADGRSLVWSTFLGGEAQDDPFSIALDLAGFPVVSGITLSTLFPITPGVVQSTLRGPDDAFVTKLDPTGASLAWSTYLGGSGFDGATASVAGTGAIVVAGGTSSTDFPVTPGSYQTTYGGGISDGFVGMMTGDGKSLTWATYLGASGSDGAGPAVDFSGTIYIEGMTSSADFPATCDAFDRSFNGESDAFLAELSSNGSQLVYATFLGSTGFEDSRGMGLDQAGNAYLTGATDSAEFPTTPGAFDPSYNGGNDTWIVKHPPTRPNTPPTLSWTGAPGYVADGLDPETGTTQTTFAYRVRYADADNDTPARIDVRIEKPLGTPWGTLPTALQGWAGPPGNYTAGAIYGFNTTLPAGTDYWYSFRASDGCDAATGPPAIPIDAPNVILDEPPIAVARASPTAVHIGDLIAFDGSASHDDFGIVRYEWDFDSDGWIDALGATRSWNYTTRGTFLATLRVVDTAGQADNDSLVIDVENRPPVARLTANRSSALVGEAVAFDGSASTDADGTIVDYAFAFGDGEPANGTGAMRAHAFEAPGTYTITLTVTDDAGSTSSAQATVEITTPVPPTPARMNWKPLVAAVFAAILAIAGAWGSSRRPWKGGTSRKSMLAAFAFTSLPFVIAEASTGGISLATGLLAIPPLWGLGTAVDVGILAAGLAVSFLRIPRKRRQS